MKRLVKDKYYQQYVIITSGNKNKKHILYGINTGEVKGVKILSLTSEQEIIKAKNYYQIRSNIYFELKTKVYKTVVDIKSNYNPSKLMVYNYESIVKDVIKKVEREYLEKQNIVKNISNDNLVSSITTTKTIFDKEIKLK